MNDQEKAIWLRLRPLLQRALPDADVEAIAPETTADDVAGWDSVAHVTLIADIEDEFAILFTPEEIVDFSNMGELVALISRKQKECR